MITRNETLFFTYYFFAKSINFILLLFVITEAAINKLYKWNILCIYMTQYTFNY